jgi:GTP-binding protein Era
MSTDGTAGGDGHLDLARRSLRDLIDDERVPASVRDSLREDYEQVRAMLEKLEHGHLHIAAFGRVGTGKSSLLNVLLGREEFSVSPLHGETQTATMRSWEQCQVGGVFLIDTPGIDEMGGEAREQLAREVAERADLVLFVADGDMTEPECQALAEIASLGRPILLVVNKADRYTESDLDIIRRAVHERTGDWVDPRNIVFAAARPAPAVVLQVDADGNETEVRRQRPPSVEALETRLWQVLESEGKSLAALNAGLFAGRLTDQVTERMMAARRGLAEKLIHTYCVGKGVAVALNPVPVADLAAAAAIDATMVYHLSRLYGLPLTRSEAGKLVSTIVTQVATLMGTIWVVHLASSALKLGTVGLSTVLTAGAQGAVAYYGTYVVGKAAEAYLAEGKSWGEGGPKRAVQQILDELDTDSVLSEARAELRSRLKRSKSDTHE